MSTVLLHSIPETIEMIGLGRSTIYELMTSGRLPYVKVGTRRLVPHDSIVNFVATLTPPAEER